MTSRVGREFSDVDAAADPARCVTYLDALGAALRAGKRQRDALLGLRPGDAVLEIGCGTGDDVRALAPAVRPHGRVVGLDASASLIAEARRRTGALDGSVEFVVGDAHALPFVDGAFDAARVERTLQHVADPPRVIGELARVVRRGGVIVACEPDWGTLAIDAAQPELVRAAELAVCEAIPHAWVGRTLRRQLLDAGCIDVEISCEVLVIDERRPAALLEDLRALATMEPGMAELFRDVAERHERGRLFCAITLVTATGRTA